jgi:uncharacterized membrane protein YcaP (DUF421 family)
MKPEEIKITDWQRIFIGEVPPSFFLEIVIRVTFVYILLVISMRLLGKRMSSQLTRNELAALVSLAAAIGVPILAPDRGLLPGIVIALIVVSISRLISITSAKNLKIENVTQGKMDVLVKDAVINTQAIERTRITKERIMAQLRAEQILQLGEVERLYMEANGNFTTIRNKKPKPGLSVIPEDDKAFLSELKSNGIYVCHECGHENPAKRKESSCPNCGHKNWVPAVMSTSA